MNREKQNEKMERRMVIYKSVPGGYSARRPMRETGKFCPIGFGATRLLALEKLVANERRIGT